MRVSSKNVVVGVLMVGAGTGVAYAQSQGHEWPKERFTITSDMADPSTAMSDGFNGFIGAIELAGLGVIGYGGYRQLRYGFDRRQRAIRELAHAQNTGNRGLQRVGGGLALAAATTIGVYATVAEGMARSQETAGSAFARMVGGEGQANIHVITNTDKPELFNDAAVPSVIAKAINPRTATISGRPVVPISRSFHNIFPDPSDKTKKLLSPTFGIPRQFINLPASKNCNNISIIAPQELGKKVGETFELDGLTVKVGRTERGLVGVNLFPLGMNQDDYSNCLMGGSQSSYNFLLSQGDKKDIEDMVKQNGGNSGNPSSRVFVTPLETLGNNTKKTGENTANGMVGLAVLLGSGFILSALSAQLRAKYVQEQGANAVYMANGMSRKDVAQIYRERADSASFKAAIVAMGGIALITAAANKGMPGATLGVSTETFLATLGYTAGCTRLGNWLAAHKELRKSNVATERTTA